MLALPETPKEGSSPDESSLLSGSRRRLGTLVRTAKGIRSGRRALSVCIFSSEREADAAHCGDAKRKLPHLDHTLDRNRKCWWIPASNKDASLFHFAMQKMDIVVLSENGTMAHF